MLKTFDNRTQIKHFRDVLAPIQIKAERVNALLVVMNNQYAIDGDVDSRISELADELSLEVVIGLNSVRHVAEEDDTPF